MRALPVNDNDDDAEGSRSAARRRGEVPHPTQVPAAGDHLGRRGDVVLLQGEVARDPQGLLRTQPVPVAARETSTGRGHRPDDDAGQQLVQEPAAEGPRQRGQGQVRCELVCQTRQLFTAQERN